MAQTHDVGSWFFHRMAYPGRKFPLCEKGDTQETSYPYRRATSVVLRLPLTRYALVVGRWGQPQDEEEALLRSLVLGEKRDNVQEGQAFTPYQQGP